VTGSDPAGDVVRQAAQDAVQALLRHPWDDPRGSYELREVTAWLARHLGGAAMLGLAEELAVDLAEAFTAPAAVDRVDPLVLADRWFHDHPPPSFDPAPPASPVVDQDG